jgi:hypothetical protein
VFGLRLLRRRGLASRRGISGGASSSALLLLVTPGGELDVVDVRGEFTSGDIHGALADINLALEQLFEVTLGELVDLATDHVAEVFSGEELVHHLDGGTAEEVLLCAAEGCDITAVNYKKDGRSLEIVL